MLRSAVLETGELYRFSWIACNGVVRTVFRCLAYPALALRSPCTSCFFVMTKFSPLMREAVLRTQNESV